MENFEVETEGPQGGDEKQLKLLKEYLQWQKADTGTLFIDETASDEERSEFQRMLKALLDGVYNDKLSLQEQIENQIAEKEIMERFNQ